MKNKRKERPFQGRSRTIKETAQGIKMKIGILGFIFGIIFFVLVALLTFSIIKHNSTIGESTKPELTYGERLSFLAMEQCDQHVAYAFGQDSFETPGQAFLFYSIAIMRSFAVMGNENDFVFREKARHGRRQASSILEEDVPRRLQKQARKWYESNCLALGE